jgi:hypothetical protein
MRRTTRVLASLLSVALISGLAVTLSGASGATPSPLCPAVNGVSGSVQGCAFVVTVGPGGTVSVTGSADPFDAQEDTAYGVVNNSGGTLLSVALTGPDVFGFDADGLCTYAPADCSTSDATSSGYGGPGTSFTVADANDGSVSFPPGGLAAGSGTYFSLEGPGATGVGATVVTATSISGTEGASFNGTVATITSTSAATAGQFTSTINWGDTSSSTGSVNGPIGGPFTVTGSHTYTEEGTPTPSVTVADSTVTAPDNVAVATGSATISDASLSATPHSLAPQTTGVPSPAMTVATFTDANSYATASDFTATIAWGDGDTNPETVTGPSGGVFTVADAGGHAYATHGTGTFNPVVTILDDGGSPATATDTVAVADTVIPCTGGSCKGSLTTTTLNLQASTTTTGTGDVLFSTNPDTGANTLDCGDGFRHAPSVISESDTLVPGSSSITETDTFKAATGTKGTGIQGLFFWVCFRTSQPSQTFKDLFGKTTNQGLLPICNPFHVGAGPCVNYVIPAAGGNIVEKLTYPVGDPTHH